MKANELLLWMSARREGSWAQFRGAVEELHMDSNAEGCTGSDDEFEVGEFPIYQELRLNFQRLGHAEFYAEGCRSGWRVAPPVLATTDAPCGSIGVLCGARTLRLLEAFATKANGLAYGKVETEAIPDVIRVTASESTALRKLAANIGVLFQPNAPVAILLNLPAVDFRHSWVRADLPFGKDWKVERFIPEKLGWTNATVQEARSQSTALYRFTFRFQRSHYLCWKGTAFEVPVQIGKYIVLRRSRQPILNYSARTQELRIPAICRPPLLMERALTLCSGEAPAYDEATRMVSYRDVPRDVARLAAQILKQNLR